MTVLKVSVLMIVVMVALSACAPAVPPPPVAAPTRGPAAEVRRLVVVPTGGSTLTMPNAPSGTNASGDQFNAGRVVGEIAKWYPQAALWASLAAVVQRGIEWLFEGERPRAANRYAQDIVPAVVVADAFARALTTSGQFDEVRVAAREPVGDERRAIEALTRITVPAWGIVRVRDGSPEPMAAYADTHAQIVARPAGAVVWEHHEDVTHGERLPWQAFSTNKDLARQTLLDVLERAGQRLANELLYARTASAQ